MQVITFYSPTVKCYVYLQLKKILINKDTEIQQLQKVYYRRIAQNTNNRKSTGRGDRAAEYNVLVRIEMF